MRLKEGDRLLVKTSREAYELTVLDPGDRLVMVRGSDPRLTGIVARLVASIYGSEKSEKRAWRSGWIGFNMRMQLKFQNHLLTCSPAVSLRVEGDGWYYDVF